MSQPRRFPLDETNQIEPETLENFWRRLIKIEEECNFESITADKLLISKFMIAITDKIFRDKLKNEKKHEMKQSIEMIKQNTCEKRREIARTQYRNH